MENSKKRGGVRRKFERGVEVKNSKMWKGPQKIKIGKKEFGP